MTNRKPEYEKVKNEEEMDEYDQHDDTFDVFLPLIKADVQDLLASQDQRDKDSRKKRWKLKEEKKVEMSIRRSTRSNLPLHPTLLVR
jgi:beta-lactamase class D